MLSLMALLKCSLERTHGDFTPAKELKNLVVSLCFSRYFSGKPLVTAMKDYQSWPDSVRDGVRKTAYDLCSGIPEIADSEREEVFKASVEHLSAIGRFLDGPPRGAQAKLNEVSGR